LEPLELIVSLALTVVLVAHRALPGDEEGPIPRRLDVGHRVFLA